jgi:PhzF family phenazine biosynthesis protein
MTAKRKTLPFHLVDVFAVEPLTGNPLAVVDGGTDLAPGLFQRIAREFNQSETTFLLPPTRPEADWRFRSFTATGAEVFGAGGHNSLGVWWWLAQAGRLALTGSATEFHQEIGDRVLPVTISRVGGRLANVVMEQEAPVAGRHGRSRQARSVAGLTAAD